MRSRRERWLMIMCWLRGDNNVAFVSFEQIRIFPKSFLLVNLYQKENNYIYIFFFLSLSLTHACMNAHICNTHIYTCMCTIYAYISHIKRKERREIKIQTLKFLSTVFYFFGNYLQYFINLGSRIFYISDLCNKWHFKRAVILMAIVSLFYFSWHDQIIALLKNSVIEAFKNHLSNK